MLKKFPVTGSPHSLILRKFFATVHETMVMKSFVSLKMMEQSKSSICANYSGERCVTKSDQHSLCYNSYKPSRLLIRRKMAMIEREEFTCSYSGLDKTILLYTLTCALNELRITKVTTISDMHI